MKHLILLTIALGLSLSAIAQNVTVPKPVLKSFKKSYPSITKVEWEKEHLGYEAEFEMKGKEMSVTYDEKGVLIETEVEISVKELPKSCAAYVSENYKGQKIKEAAKITKADGTIYYEVELKDLDLLFDSEGNFQSTEAEDEEDQD